MLRTKLVVGPADDPAEREAEAVAARIDSGRDAEPALASVDSGNAAPLRRVALDQQPGLDSLESQPPIPAEHEAPTVSAEEDVDEKAVDAGDMAEIESGEPETLTDGAPTDAAPAADAADAAGGEEGPPAGADPSTSATGNEDAGDVVLAPLRRDQTGAPAVGKEGGPAPPDVAARVAQPGSGRALPQPVADQMGQRFGFAFDDVRIHDTADDRQTAQRIGARAFTLGRDIWLGPGESVNDRRLMAHELTHVVQQTKRQRLDGHAATNRQSCPKQDAPTAEEHDQALRREPTVRRGWIANKLEKYARHVPGYTLVTVILGKSPITGERVERTAENLIGGFLGLLPGGQLIFDRLKETRALIEAADWVERKMTELDITWSRVKALIGRFWDEVSFSSPIADAKRIFGPLVASIVTFVKAAAGKILEFVLKAALKLAGPRAAEVWNIIKKTGTLIATIVKNPLAFAKNLASAVMTGFRQFKSNIGDHLKRGFLGWLFGALDRMNLKMPQKLDFRGLMDIVLQVLGLTYQTFRKHLVRALGSNGERKVAYLEKSVEIVRLLLKRGFIGIWQLALSMIDGFRKIVLKGLGEWLVKTVVRGGIQWLAGLTNPIGAIVKVALSIYELIVTFIERLDQIKDLALAVFGSLSEIVKGNVKRAANFMERTMGAMVPLIIAFLGALVPVRGITQTIRRIIKRLQAPIARMMKKLASVIRKKTKKLFSRIIGKLNRKRKLPGVRFHVGNQQHRLFTQKKGRKMVLMMASDRPETSDKKQAEVAVQAEKAQKMGDDNKELSSFRQVSDKEVDEAERETANMAPESKKKNQKKAAGKAVGEIRDAGAKLDAVGKALANDLFIDTDPDGGELIRAREPRIPEVEGKVDTYFKRSEATRAKVSEAGAQMSGANAKRRLSNFYENDHLPEKSLGLKVRDFIHKELMRMPTADGEVVRDGPKVKRGKGAGQPRKITGGTVDQRADFGEGAMIAMTVYRPQHRQKTSQTRRDHDSVVAAARNAKSRKKDASAADHLAARVSKLQQGLRVQLDSEIDHTTGLYNADKDASKAIRASVKAGIRELYRKNQQVWGIAKRVEAAAALDDTVGSDGGSTKVPMAGGGPNKAPNFVKMEGGLYIHGRTSKLKVGDFMEFDHVIEGSVADKARDLYRDRLAPAISAAGEMPRRPLGPDQAQRENEVAGNTPFAGSAAIHRYRSSQAKTIGLYRPIHREVSNEVNPYVKDVDLLKKSGGPGPLASAAASYIADGSKKGEYDAAKVSARQSVEQVFGEVLNRHVAAIKRQYTLEQSEVPAENTSKKAASAIQTIVSRVNSSMGKMRRTSLNLIK